VTPAPGRGSHANQSHNKFPASTIQPFGFQSAA
jgi:hypothetical protein